MQRTLFAPQLSLETDELDAGIQEEERPEYEELPCVVTH